MRNVLRSLHPDFNYTAGLPLIRLKKGLAAMRPRALGIVIAVFVVLALAVPASAQLMNGGRGSFPGCPQCGLWSWVDFPTDQETVSASKFYLQGWGFECESGQPADRVDVYYQDYDGINRPLKQPSWALMTGAVARPDVVAAFGVACPNVAANTGWQLRVLGMPLGLRRVTINVWRGPYLETHKRTYLVKP